MRIRSNPIPRSPGKALAVLSCALALLAAHPLLAKAGTQETPAAVRTIGDAGRVSSPVVAMSRRVWQNPSVAPMSAAPIVESRKSTIENRLVAYLARMLMANLAPVAAPPLVPALTQLTIDAPAVLPMAEVRGIVFPDLPPPSERSFALAHQLLAPPV